MNTAPKNKILLLIISILVIANIAMLVFYFKEQPATGKKERMDRQKFITAYLKTDIGFNESQLKQYEEIGNKHKEGIKKINDSLSIERKRIFAQLARENFNDSIVAAVASALKEQQAVFSFKILQHIKDIRSICNDEQRAKFDTSFYKIIGRRPGDTSKSKKN